MHSGNSWESLYQFLLNCGKEHDPYNFCGKIVQELHNLVLYDQARVIFISVTGKINGSMLYGANQHDWNTFMSYYLEDTIGSLYSLKRPLKISEKEKVSLCDWTDNNRKIKYRDFAENYVQPLRLKYCLGMGLSDSENCIRSIITLDRIQQPCFTEDDITLIRLLHPLLENLFINMLLPTPEPFSTLSFIGNQYSLTDREIEVAELLCNGATPSTISSRLCVSVTTIYKHIANMYKKLNITNRQELFAKLHK